MEKKDTPKASKSPKSSKPAKAAPVAAENVKTKKSKKGLIATIISLIVIIAGAVAVAILISNCQKSPESVVSDAITKSIKQKSRKITGSVEMTAQTVSTSASGNYKTAVRLDLDSKNNGMNNATAATVTISGTGSSDFVFRFDEVLQDDGTLYLKSADFASFVNSLASAFGAYLNMEPLSSIVREVKNLAAKISDSWWRISVPSVLDLLGVEDRSVFDGFDCMVKSSKSLFEDAGQTAVADAYKKHRFLKAEKSSDLDYFKHNGYKVTINSDQLVDFWNQYIESDVVKDIAKCNVGTEGVKTAKPISKEAVSSLEGEDFYLDIDNDNNLKGIYLNKAKDNYNIKTKLYLEDNDEKIEAPAYSKPVTDLTKDIMKIIESAAGLFAMMMPAQQ